MTIPSRYAIDAILEAARERVAELAEAYRKDVLVPFCREHRLTYIAGNGRTVFYAARGDRSFGSPGEARVEGYAAAVPIFEVLDQPAIGREDYFGFYIRDVTRRDIRRPRS